MFRTPFILFFVVAAGCAPPDPSAAKHRPDQATSQSAAPASLNTNPIPAAFACINTNTTLQQVIDRVGKFDRIRGSGISYYEYDLPGGSAVLIGPAWPFNNSSRIRNVTFYPNASEIGLYP